MIVEDTFPIKDSDIAIRSIKITYCQNLDCEQTEEEYPEGLQYLTLETEDGGGGKFIRMSTNVWSFDKSEDLQSIITDFKNRSGIKD